LPNRGISSVKKQVDDTNDEFFEFINYCK